MRLSFLLLSIFLALTNAASACDQITSVRMAFAICVPSGWFHRELPSGALFLCTEHAGACVQSGGGMPLKGQAIISVVPKTALRNKADTGLKEFALSVLHDSGAALAANEEQGIHGLLEEVSLNRQFLIGGIGEIPKEEHHYFVRFKAHLFHFEMIYNEDDRRSKDYVDAFRSILLSLDVREQ